MSSQKRKLEEYHDPDYLTLHAKESTPSSGTEKPPKKAKLSTAETSEERLRKVREVIRREFGTELIVKEQEIDEIERRLADAKQLLAKVRYAVVSNYYTRKNLVHSAFDLKAMDTTATAAVETTATKEEARLASMPSTFGAEPEKLQPAIHPSLKKLLGKRPIDYSELLKVRPVRQAAKTATQNFHKPKRSTKLETKSVTTEVNTTIPSQEEQDSSEAVSAPSEMKMPRYVAPNARPDERIEQVNSARGRNQYRHLIVVGNTSKYIGDEERESATNVTHKWLVYIATKAAIPIDRIVSKVRFFLHESYRPNDIVEVLSAPFQIAKRGWGEFPLRVQLYFHPHLHQKPIQILHNLVLDKKHSGLQTMGAETVVEIWLNLPSSSESVQSGSEKTTNVTKVRETISTTPKIGVPNTVEKEYVSPNLNTPANKKQQIKIEPDLHINDESPKLNKFVNILEPRMNAQPPVMTTTSPLPPITLPLPKVIAKPTKNTSNFLVNDVTGKRFIKCIDKTGKVSLIEMLADPNNPKIVKMVLPAALRNTPSQLTSADAANRPISLPTQLRPSSTSVNAAVASGMQANAIRTPNNFSKRHEQVSLTKGANKTLKMANCKVVIIDKVATTSNTKAPVQQSLLRPQVSLLKLQRVDEKLPAPTGTRGLKMITVNNLSGMGNRNINVFLPKECESDNDIEIPRSKRFVVNAKDRRRFADDLETEFHRCQSFSNATASVVWLLKRVPIITSRANQHDYKASFPFVVDTIDTFESLPTPKQRCYEWLRAKFISRLISKHMLLRSSAWTTKQIIIFARTYGYSPMPIVEASPWANKDDIELKNIIKSELMREHLQNDSISFNRPIIDWLTEAEHNSETKKNTSHIGVSQNASEEIIIVDDVESVSNEEKRGRRPLGEISALPEVGKLYLPLETRFQDEASWVADVCRDVQIRLQPEEIIEGVVYPAAQTMLAVALRTFVEDLLRRSAAHSTSPTSTEKLAHVQSVNCDDVQRALIAIKHFDFLTNKRFGIGKNIPS